MRALQTRDAPLVPRLRLFAATSGVLVLVLLGLTVGTSQAGQTQGPSRGQLIGISDKGPVHLPIIKTHVAVELLGSTASVTVTQSFRNPNAKPLEAIYVFPLPENAAVHGLRIGVRDQVIKGHIKRREDVAALYAKAKKSGRTAALLDQERPNIFTQAVANIFPKSDVEVQIRFDVELGYKAGEYEFSFPMVVGPRYIPGTPDGKPATGWGHAPNTDRVPDASKITPPTTPPKTRSGRNIGLELVLDPGSAIRDLSSPTHSIRSTSMPKRSRHAVKIELAKADEIANRDFVLRYKLANKRPVVGVHSGKSERGGFFSLRFEPPPAPAAADIVAKELVLVVDTSASMQGQALELAQASMRYAIGRLGEGDTIRIVRYADDVAALDAGALDGSLESQKKALAFVDGLSADGGSEVLDGLSNALANPAPPVGRLRIIALITSGLVGNEAEVIAKVAAKLDERTRLFAFGVGTTPNRYFLNRLAALGRGTAHYSLFGPAAEAAGRTFVDRLSTPVLTDITIDWRGLAVNELQPSRPRDLFAGQPLSLVGRFTTAGKATVLVRGLMGARRVVYEVPVRLRSSGANAALLGRMWARNKVRELENEALGGNANAGEVTRLGLDFGLVTRFTSFVAIADDASVSPGKLQTVMVAVDRPSDGNVLLDKTVRDEGESRKDDVRKEETKNSPKPGTTVNRRRPTDSPPPVVGANTKSGDGLSPDVAKEEHEDDGDADARDYDGDDDDDDDDDAGYEAPAPTTRVALGGATVETDDAIRHSRVLGSSFRLGVGLSLGGTTGAGENESSFATVSSLTLERALSRRFALGGELALLIRGPETDRVIGNLLARGTFLDAVGAGLPFSLDLSAGIGPSVSNDGAGLGVMGSLTLRTPIPVGLRLRYDGAIRFGDDSTSKTTNTVSGGLEFSF